MANYFPMFSSIKWKKSKSTLQKAAEVFSQDDDEEEEEEYWLVPIKRKKLAMLEDNETASKRLEEQGIVLAENGRYACY